MDDEVFPLKWWYVGWGMLEEVRESFSQKYLKRMSLLFPGRGFREAFAFAYARIYQSLTNNSPVA